MLHSLAVTRGPWISHSGHSPLNLFICVHHLSSSACGSHFYGTKNYPSTTAGAQPHYPGDAALLIQLCIGTPATTSSSLCPALWCISRVCEPDRQLGLGKGLLRDPQFLVTGLACCSPRDTKATMESQECPARQSFPCHCSLHWLLWALPVQAIDIH